MSETLSMNDEAARSPTGEILDQTPPASSSTQTPTSDSKETTESQTTPPASTDAKAPDAKASDAKIPDAPAAPEKYADFKAPEGYTIDAKTIESATPIFRELGLSQEAAQKLVDFHTQQMIAAAKAPQATYEATRAEWQAAAKADTDMSAYAKDGKTGLDAVKIDIGRALTAINDPKLVSDFKAAMDLTGAGDNPAFIKAFWKLSQRVTEGTHVAGTGPSALGQRAPGAATKPTPAKALYPNNP